MSESQLLLSLEVISTVAGLISVALLAGGNGKGWSVGAVTIILMGWVYFARALFGSALLQVFFLGTQLVGWKRWRDGSEEDLRTRSRLLTPRMRWLSVALVLVTTALGTKVLEHWGGRAALWDSFVTSGSLAGQSLMVLGFGECWLWWLAVDLVYIVLMWQQGIYSYAVLYAVYCLIAVRGWREWTREVER